MPANKNCKSSKSNRGCKKVCSTSKKSCSKMKKYGSRQEVWEKKAHRTGPNGLTKSQLTKNKRGKIVSKAKSELAKKRNYVANIKDHQYTKSCNGKKRVYNKKSKKNTCSKKSSRSSYSSRSSCSSRSSSSSFF